MAMRNVNSVDGPRATEVESGSPQAARPGLPMSIEGPREELADEIGALSPDGRPAHPHAGPGTLVVLVVAVFIVFVLIAFGLSWWLGWFAGVAMLAIGTLAIALNPAVLANLQRLKERGTVADRHNARTGSSPSATVVRKADIEMRPT